MSLRPRPPSPRLAVAALLFTASAGLGGCSIRLTTGGPMAPAYAGWAPAPPPPPAGAARASAPPAPPAATAGSGPPPAPPAAPTPPVTATARNPRGEVAVARPPAGSSLATAAPPKPAAPPAAAKPASPRRPPASAKPPPRAKPASKPPAVRIRVVPGAIVAPPPAPPGPPHRDPYLDSPYQSHEPPPPR